MTLDCLFRHKIPSVRITTIRGDLIATEYSRVIADGESIWFEVPKDNLDFSKFNPRQRTSSRSRQFYTAHQQIERDLGLSPRRHKLAVKVQRNLPSCRLSAGKWYINVHQVRVEAQINGRSTGAQHKDWELTVWNHIWVRFLAGPIILAKVTGRLLSANIWIIRGQSIDLTMTISKQRKLLPRIYPPLPSQITSLYPSTLHRHGQAVHTILDNCHTMVLYH